MDLLLEVKRTFDDLVKLKLVDSIPPFKEVERITENCYKGKYTDLTKYLSAPLSVDNIQLLQDHINKIKELVANDKKDS